MHAGDHSVTIYLSNIYNAISLLSLNMLSSFGVSNLLHADIAVLNSYFLVLDTYFFKEAIFFYGGTPGGGGVTLILSHIRRLGLFFGVQNSEFQYFWGFQKNEYFLDIMKILWIFFFWGGGGVIEKLG